MLEIIIMAVTLVHEMHKKCVRMKFVGLGTSMAVFRIKENVKIRKYRSGRSLESGVRFLTNDSLFLVSVEPNDGVLAVWKLLPRDIERQVSYLNAYRSLCFESRPIDTVWEYMWC